MQLKYYKNEIFASKQNSYISFMAVIISHRYGRLLALLFAQRD